MRKRHFSEYIAEQLTISVMSRSLRGVDFHDAQARESAYRAAGLSSEKTCGLDQDAYCAAKLYVERIAPGRAACGVMSCVLAAALLAPSVCQAAPIFSAEGTAALAEALGWARVIFTHSLAAIAGVLLMALFVAGRSE